MQPYQIRSETIADVAAIAEVNQLAFGRQNEAYLVEQIRQSDRFIPSLSLVAEVDGKVVGHILFSYVDLVGEQQLQVLALAPMAVHPTVQRQGIGTQLVETGLAIADTMQESLIIVLGHPAFYTRFGFKPSIHYDIEPPFSVPEEAFMSKPLKHHQTTYRGIVAYPPAFNGV
ncbi:GCN5 family acetyltransferase [Nostoc minutum NIES-26]|uniref:GCN5 family acetyltransferase n=1 Tax=Nostoc minutum NIES-26 TaxID=1844469 RepID=A0A367QCQ6_9NOSO|nr:GCN5 family acetyltransferase [Nostoc minutum NIES-26]